MRRFLLLLVILAACRHEPIIPNECEDYTLKSGPDGPIIKSRGYDFHAPCFNPANPSEFIYIKDYLDSNGIPQADLRKRNLTTGEDIFLSSSFLLNSPSWHKNGWIIFEKDWQIYKITETGDSITQLTFSGQNYSPQWNPSGLNICLVSTKDVSYEQIYILHPNNTYELIPSTAGYSRSVWSPEENKIAYQYSNLLGYFLVDSKNQIPLADKGLITGISWFPDADNILWSTNKGLFKINISTRNETILKKGCRSHIYLRPTTSGDGKKILVERQDEKKVDDYTIYRETNLYLMNSDGSNERKIEF